MYAIEVENAKDSLRQARRIKRLVQKVSGGLLHSSGYEVLELLTHAPPRGMGTGEIAAELRMGAYEVSRILGRLLLAELVARKGHGGAARVTAAGRELADRIGAAITESGDAENWPEDDDEMGWVSG